jgi:hypothetical protein
VANIVHYSPPDDLGRIVDRLQQQLRALGITPNPSCELVRACKEVLALDAELKATGGTRGGDFGRRVHSILPVRQWCRMLEEGIGTSLEGDLRQLAGTITSGDPALHRDGPRSKDRDVAFEVYAACLATRFATDVRLDGPDLLFRFGGQTIGVACKAIYGNDVSKPLRKGRDQIEAAKCDAGIVLVQLTNRIPRNELFRCINQATQEYTVWTRAADALRRFDELAITAADPLRDEAPKAMGRSTKTLGVVAIAEGVCYSNDIAITLLHLCQGIACHRPLSPKLDEITLAFGEALNKPRV